MRETTLQIQVCYEIAMSIGNSLDLGQMLKQSISTYLRKLNCSAGVVLQAVRHDARDICYTPVFSIPRRIDSNSAVQHAMGTIAQHLDAAENARFLSRLPLSVEQEDRRFSHLMPLKDFGLLLLLRGNRPLDPVFVKSLQPLNNKLAEACYACRQSEKVQDLVQNLQCEAAEREKAQKSLMASRRKYKSIFDNIQDVYFECTRDGIMLEVSPSAERVFGVTREDLIGKWIGEIATDKKERQVFVRILEEQGSLHDHEIHLQNQQGVIFPCAVNAMFQKIGPDNQLKITGSIRDISQRHAAEIALKQAKEKAEATSHQLRLANTELRKLHRAVEQSPITVVITDHKGCIEYVNPKFSHLTGYTYEEAVGLRPQALLSDQNDRRLLRRMCKTLLRGDIWQGELLSKTRQGSLFWEQAFVAPVKDENGKMTNFIALKEDITWRKEAEARLMRSQKELEIANAARNQFLINMSHEMRTPLNGVIGMAGLLLGTVLDIEQQDMARNIRMSAASLLTAMNNILDYSKILAGQLALEESNFALDFLVGEVIGLMQPIIGEKKIDLIDQIAPGTPMAVRGDDGRLKQVLINLVDNAIKFTQDGVVTLRIKAQKETDQHVTLDFSVSDTGIGIQAECQKNVFDGFYQQDVSMTRRYGGTGMGLTISKSLVEMMGGTIGVQSRPGQGTTFWFTLDLEKQSQVRSNRSAAPGALIKASAEDLPSVELPILVAEDNPINLKLTLKMLETLGYQAEGVPNGREVLEAMALKDYCLVLMDIQMPEMDGLEATREIRSSNGFLKTPAIPIVALTAHAMKADRQACMDAGMNDYLTKPVDPKLLIEVLQKYLAT